jgi:hypothetical protein
LRGNDGTAVIDRYFDVFSCSKGMQDGHDATFQCAARKRRYRAPIEKIDFVLFQDRRRLLLPGGRLRSNQREYGCC